jgi:hypothetical protein
LFDNATQLYASINLRIDSIALQMYGAAALFVLPRVQKISSDKNLANKKTATEAVFLFLYHYLALKKKKIQILQT